MKLTIDNLGCIKHAELDIAPLTIFVGPNNTNKTWTAYVLYALIRACSSRDRRELRRNKSYYNLAKRDSVLHDSIERLSAQAAQFLLGVTKLEAKSTSVSRRELLANTGDPTWATFDSVAIAHVMAIESELVADANAKLVLESAGSSLPERISWETAFAEMGIGFDTFVDDHPVARSQLMNLSGDGLVKSYIAADLSRLFLPPIQSFALPAERKISTLLLSLKRFSPTTKDDSASVLKIPRPILDFTDAVEQASWLSDWAKYGEPSLSDFPELRAVFQDRLLKGQVEFSAEQKLGSRRLEYTAVSGPRVALHAASSRDIVKSCVRVGLF